MNDTILGGQGGFILRNIQTTSTYEVWCKPHSGPSIWYAWVDWQPHPQVVQLDVKSFISLSDICDKKEDKIIIMHEVMTNLVGNVPTRWYDTMRGLTMIGQRWPTNTNSMPLLWPWCRSPTHMRGTNIGRVLLKVQFEAITNFGIGSPPGSHSCSLKCFGTSLNKFPKLI